jgi:Flp pilus assembly protein TadD
LAGHYKNAIVAFREGIRREPSSARLYNNLGLALAKLGRDEEALLAFMEHGNEAQALNNLGCVYLQQGEQKKAIRAFEKALEIKPDFYHKASQNLKKAKAGRVYDIFSIKSDN